MKYHEHVRSPTTCVRKEPRTVRAIRREAKVLRDRRNAPRTRKYNKHWDWAFFWGMGWVFVSLVNRLCRLSRVCPRNGGTSWLRGILGCLWRSHQSPTVAMNIDQSTVLIFGLWALLLLLLTWQEASKEARRNRKEIQSHPAISCLRHTAIE